MRKYQERLNEILKESPFLIGKLTLLYELNCLFDLVIDDDLIDDIYQAYLDNKNYNSVSDFARAIFDWCLVHETDFDLIEDYGKMLKEIY